MKREDIEIGEAYLVLVAATEMPSDGNMVRCVTADEGEVVMISPENMFDVRGSSIPEAIRKAGIL